MFQIATGFLARRLRCLLLPILLALWAGNALAQVCATPGKDGVNYSAPSYYPGVSVSGSQVTVGAIRTGTGAGSTAVAVGDLLLLIQMQDAQINNTDSIAYGDGATGRGWTSLRASGQFEFRRVQAVNGAGTVFTLDAAPTNTYVTAAATATDGSRTFQVIRVPQYASITLPGGTLTPPAWNGGTGGIWVIDVTGTLNMNGTTIDASSSGFRGGGGIESGVLSGVGSVYYATPTLSVTAGSNNGGGFKGEGIAGTPRYVRNAANPPYSFTDLGVSGYPSSRDMARGAPGNAGGGGTQHNAAGGGGSNSGLGGRGGNSYATYSTTDTGGCVAFGGGFFGCGGDGARAVGGLGGGTLTASISRILLGGGGGAGDSNNSADNAGTAQNAGGNGGGIVFVRANLITGAGSLLANGQAGLPGGRDGAGGGGAGGTVLVATNTTNPNLTIQANGGAGGNSGLPLRAGETQGPGGGGGGGAVILSTGTTPASVSFAGGIAGVNSPAAGVTNVYGSGAGGGTAATVNMSNSIFPLANNCLPQLSVTKVTTTPSRVVPTDNTAQYVITVTNASGAGIGAAAGVAVVDTLSVPFQVSATTATASTASAAGPAAAAVTGSTVATIGTPGGTVANSYLLLPGGTVTLTWTVSIDGAVAGTYQNSASVTFSDPTRTAAGTTVSPGGTYTAGGTVPGSNYDAASGTGEDVVVSGAGSTVTSAGTLCPAATTVEATTTNVISNASFSNTAAPLGQFGAVGLAAVNTQPSKNSVSYQVGLQSYTGGGNQVQYPFPGDPARNIASTNHWVYAHGYNPNTLPFGAWSQTVTGLSPGTTYTFIVYASSPFQPGVGDADNPTLALDITQTAAISIALGTVPDDTAGTGDVWTLYQAAFQVTGTTATFAIRNINTTNGSTDRGRFAFTQPTLRMCRALANLSVTKNDSNASVTSGFTTTYTITASNTGPATATGVILTDTPSAGLDCTDTAASVSCSGATGGASCPVAGVGAGQLSLANLLGAGVLIDLPPSSTISFATTCRVTALGL